MPIGFILLGVTLIYSLFFLKKEKVLISVFCLILMSAYFVPTIKYDNFSINLIIIFLLILTFVYLLIKNKNYNCLLYAIILNFTYIVIVKLNSDFLTILNPVLVFVMATFIGLIISNKLSVLQFFISSTLLLTISNIFLEQPLGYVLIGDLNLINFLIISCFVCLMFSIIKEKFGFLQRRKV